MAFPNDPPKWHHVLPTTVAAGRARTGCPRLAPRPEPMWLSADQFSDAGFVQSKHDFMLPPVRCFSCNAIVPNRELAAAVENGEDAADAIHLHQLCPSRRICCLRMLVSQQHDLLDVLMKHNTTGFVNDCTKLRLGVHAQYDDDALLPKVVRTIRLDE